MLLKDQPIEAIAMAALEYAASFIITFTIMLMIAKYLKRHDVHLKTIHAHLHIWPLRVALMQKQP